jgi:hypothetical protein
VHWRIKWENNLVCGFDNIQSTQSLRPFNIRQSFRTKCSRLQIRQLAPSTTFYSSINKVRFCNRQMILVDFPLQKMK